MFLIIACDKKYNGMKYIFMSTFYKLISNLLLKLCKIVTIIDRFHLFIQSYNFLASQSFAKSNVTTFYTYLCTDIIHWTSVEYDMVSRSRTPFMSPIAYLHSVYWLKVWYIDILILQAMAIVPPCNRILQNFVLLYHIVHTV